MSFDLGTIFTNTFFHVTSLILEIADNAVDIGGLTAHGEFVGRCACFRDNDPQYHVHPQADAAEKDEQEHGQTDPHPVNVKVRCQSAAHTTDHLVIRVAEETSFHLLAWLCRLCRSCSPGSLLPAKFLGPAHDGFYVVNVRVQQHLLRGTDLFLH